MSYKPQSKKKTLRISTLLLSIFAALVIVSVAAAALYTINTDDGSVNEWGPSGQNIPVWETDPQPGIG